MLQRSNGASIAEATWATKYRFLAWSISYDVAFCALLLWREHGLKEWLGDSENDASG